MHRLVAALLLCAACGGPNLPTLTSGNCNPCPETNPQIVGGLLFCQCSSASALAFAVEFPLAPASFPACSSWASQWSQFSGANCR